MHQQRPPAAALSLFPLLLASLAGPVAAAPEIQAYMQRLADAGYSPGQILTHLDQLLTRQSYTMATNDIYWVAVGIAGCLIALIWSAKPPFNLGGPRAR